MKDHEHFFKVGGTLSAGVASYIERPADAELVTQLVKDEWCLVLAPRQTGKSSLMIHARDGLVKQGTWCAVVDLQPLGGHQEINQWFRDMLYQMERTLKLKTDSGDWWEAHAGLGATQRFARFIEEVALKECDGRIVVFLDEIDSLLSLDFSDDVFTTLRSLYNARAVNAGLERLSFVLLGVASASEFIKDKTRTPFNIGVSITLGDFSRESVEPFQTVLGSDSIALVDRIFYWTQGQPLLVQRLAANANTWPSAERTSDRLDREVEAIYLNAKIENDTHLKFIQDYLLDTRSNISKTLALYRRILRGEEVRDDDVSREKSRLKLAGVVRSEDDRLLTRNRIYATLFDVNWVDRHTPKNKTKILAYASTFSVLILVTSYIFILGPNLKKATEEKRLALEKQRQAIELAINTNEARLASIVETLDDPEKPMVDWLEKTLSKSQQLIQQGMIEEAQETTTRLGSGLAQISPILQQRKKMRVWRERCQWLAKTNLRSTITVANRNAETADNATLNAEWDTASMKYIAATKLFETMLPEAYWNGNESVEDYIARIALEAKKEIQLELVDGVLMQFTLIPPGSFIMGSPEKEQDRDDDEQQHPVTISKPFYLGIHEVTKGQFSAFLSTTNYQTDAEKLGSGYAFPEVGLLTEREEINWITPGFDQADDHPVVIVSWNDAQEFCNWLEKQTEYRIRLPSEAQWEYACRAGTSTGYYWGDSPDDGSSWYNGADQSAKDPFPNWWTVFNWDDGFVFTAPVGHFKANRFGLYDMHGNVWEWCQDWYREHYYGKSPVFDPVGPLEAETFRVLRGGSWGDDPWSLRPADRYWNSPDYRNVTVGFRVLLDFP